MFCTNCGQRLDESAKFCNICGAQIQPCVLEGKPVEEPAVEPVAEPVAAPVEVPAAEPAAEPVTAPAAEPVPAPVAQEKPAYLSYTPPQFPVKTEKPKKVKKVKKKSFLGRLVKTAVFLGVAVAGFLYWDNIVSFFMRSFATPEAYLTHVEMKSADRNIDKISEAYGELLGLMGGEQWGISPGERTEVRVKISDDLVQILETAIGEGAEDVELDWLSDVQMNFLNNATDGVSRTDIAVGLGKTDIAGVSVVVDGNNGDLYVALPELSDTYMHIYLGQALNGSLEEAAVQDLLELLPSEEKINEVLGCWWRIVLENVDDVEMDTDTVEVDGLEQELTVLEYEVTEECLYDMAIAILQDLKEDEEMLQIVYAVIEQIPYVDGKVVDQVFDSVIEKLEEDRENAENKRVMQMTVYVDYTDTIVGRVITFEGGEAEIPAISYLTVWEDDEFAFEADLAQLALVTGSGSREKGLVEGEYDVTVGGENIVTVELSDYDQRAAKQGYLNGSFTLMLSDELMQKAMEKWEDSELITKALEWTRVELELEFKNTWRYSQCGVGINVGGLDIVKVSSSAEQLWPETVNAPEDTVEIVDVKGMLEWFRSMELDQIIENLEDAGMPQDMVDALNEFLSQQDNS